MQTVTTWAPPIALSLLLHATVIVLVTKHLSVIIPVKSAEQIITVELLQQASSVTSKLQSKISNQKNVALTKPETVEPEHKAAENITQAESITPTVTPLKTAVNSQSLDSKVESDETITAVQPLSKITRLPSFLRKIEPVYPSSERRAGIQSSVLAEITIDNKGKLQTIKIVKSAGIHFDNAVIDALKKSQFSPAYIDNEPVAVRVIVPFRFNLN